MNKNLNASNEKGVLALVQNCKVKAEWQAYSFMFNKKYADQKISGFYGVPISTVRAASYYW